MKDTNKGRNLVKITQGGSEMVDLGFLKTNGMKL
jgi:hypothetical protein